MKLVYIAHPFGGKRRNVRRVEHIIKRLLKTHNGTTFYSPLHATGFFYNELSHEEGMKHCVEMLKRCDELWLCEGWIKSRGCLIEHSYAVQHNMPIIYLDNILL